MDDPRKKRQKLNYVLQKQAEVIAEFLSIFPEVEDADPDELKKPEQTAAASYQDLVSGFFGMVELSGELLIKEVRHGKDEH